MHFFRSFMHKLWRVLIAMELGIAIAAVGGHFRTPLWSARHAMIAAGVVGVPLVAIGLIKLELADRGRGRGGGEERIATDEKSDEHR